MQELAILLGSIVLSVLTNYGKKYTGLHPLILVAMLCVVSGIWYAALTKVGYWETFKEWCMLVGSGSIATYSVFKPLYKKITGKEIGKSLYALNAEAAFTKTEVSKDVPEEVAEEAKAETQPETTPANDS